MRRYRTVILAAGILAALASACGNSGAKPAATTAAATTAAAETTAAATTAAAETTAATKTTAAETTAAGKEAKAAETTAEKETTAAGASTAETTAAESAAEAELPKTEEWHSADGWTVRYRPDSMEVTELPDGARFACSGLEKGSGVLEIRCVPDKQPEELLAEVTESWTSAPENIGRTEGIFPGTEDRWGFWRSFSGAEGSGEPYRTAIAGEYNGGVLLFDIRQELAGDDGIDMKISDLIAEVVDTIAYDDFQQQKMYDYVPGKYVSADAQDDPKAPVELQLSENHQGKLILREEGKDEQEVSLIWGSTQLTSVDDPGVFWEYTVEGDSLYVNLSEEWAELVKIKE